MPQLANGAINGGLVDAKGLSPLTGLLRFFSPFSLGQFTESLFQQDAIFRRKLTDSFQNFFNGDGTHLIHPTAIFCVRPNSYFIVT
jgi:hypothetical protein